MKAKVKSSGEIVEVEQLTRTTAICPANGKIYNRLQLDLDFDSDLDPQHPSATISGWVARDKLTNSVALYPIKPSRFDGMWNCPGADSVFVIDSDLFSSLTWQDDPLEVEIVIKPKKQ